jgi:hypothetical protein
MRDVKSGGPILALDIAFGVVLVGLLVAALLSGFGVGPVRPGATAVLTGLYIQSWGALFIGSYFFPDGRHLLRALVWVCEHTSTPRGAWTAIPWGIGAFVVGGAGVLQGLGVVPPR